VKFEEAKLLPDAGEQAVRSAVISQVESDRERYLSEYTQRFGNVLNADNAATLFPEYNEDPAKYREAVHPAAQWIRDELLRRALAEPEGNGDGRIIFTAGGNAAGKSTAVAIGGVSAEAQVVLDSTLSNPQHAERLVRMAVDAGKAVGIIHVDRPLEDAMEAMLDRARSEGRVVTIDQLTRSQRGAVETMRALWNAFRDNPAVGFRFLNNSPDGAEVRPGIAGVAPQDYNKGQERLNAILDREYRTGRITEDVYRRIKGGDAQPTQPGTPGSGGRPDSGRTESPAGAETGATRPDPFGEETLKAHMRLTKVWREGGREAIKRELLKMYPDLAEKTSQPEERGGSQEPPDKT
jgi:predicted kinase